MTNAFWNEGPKFSKFKLLKCVWNFVTVEAVKFILLHFDELFLAINCVWWSLFKMWILLSHSTENIFNQCTFSTDLWECQELRKRVAQNDPCVCSWHCRCESPFRRTAPHVARSWRHLASLRNHSGFPGVLTVPLITDSANQRTIGTRDGIAPIIAIPLSLCCRSRRSRRCRE